MLGQSGERSRRLAWSAVAAVRPELIVIAPCGFGLIDASALASELLGAGHLPPGVPVWAVDADSAFVRPGPRLIDGVETLAGICHPDARPLVKELCVPIR